MQPEQSKKLIEERNIRAALLKLSKSASRENQRLDALRQAWVSNLILYKNYAKFHQDCCPYKKPQLIKFD